MRAHISTARTCTYVRYTIMAVFQKQQKHQFQPACRCCFGCITFISLYSRKKDNSEPPKRDIGDSSLSGKELQAANVASFPGPIRKIGKGPGSTSVLNLSLLCTSSNAYYGRTRLISNIRSADYHRYKD